MYVVDGDHDNEAAYFHNVLPYLCHVSPWRGLAGTLNTYATYWSKYYTRIGFMGDDHFPRTVGFDAAIHEAGSSGPSIVYGEDGSGQDLPTWWVMDSRIVVLLNQMVPYVLRHNYVDNYVQELGRGGDCLVKTNVLIEHMHPMWGKASLDDSYELSSYHYSRLADARNWEEYRMFQLPKDINLLRKYKGLDRDLAWV